MLLHSVRLASRSFRRVSFEWFYIVLMLTVGAGTGAYAVFNEVLVSGTPYPLSKYPK